MGSKKNTDVTVIAADKPAGKSCSRLEVEAPERDGWSQRALGGKVLDCRWDNLRE
jgi:hypothetical protein